jgi:hypothetical protein
MPVDPSAVQSNFVTRYRRAINALLDAREALKALRELAATQGYPGSFVAGAGAFADNNADLQAADLAAAFDEMDALESKLTDFTKTPPQPTPGLAALLKFRP